MMKKLIFILFLTIGFNVQGQLIGLIASQTLTSSTDGTPVLSNFHIDDDTPTHVEFDASANVTLMGTTGFVISGKTISSLTIDEDGLGGYFTVSTPFTFWDNNTIRLGENDDTSHSQSILYNFTLTYIENNIDEPDASTNRYVAVGGTGDGTSEVAAANLNWAIDNTSAGQTWWVKAGNYGAITNNNNFTCTGTPTNPIKFIGYKTTIGDITTNYLNYGDTISSSEMPTLDGGGASSGDLLQIQNNHYVIFRNMQITNGHFGVNDYSTATTHVVFDRFNITEMGSSTDPSGSGIKMDDGYYIRVQNSVFINNNMSAIVLAGATGGSLIKDCKTYSDYTTDALRSDYQISIKGSNSIITHCHSENINDTSTNGSTHGVGVKSEGTTSEYNLIANCTAVNFLEGLYLRNVNTNKNVIKDCIATKTHTGGYTGEVSGGIWIWGGANDNIVERNEVSNTIYGIAFKDNALEDGTPSPATGDRNIIRNNIITNTKFAIITTSNEVGSTCDDNMIYNNTFKDVDSFFRWAGNQVIISNMRITNNIFDNVGSPSSTIPAAMSFDYNNFNSSWTTGIGTNDINVDPNFVSATDFEPQEALLLDVPKLFEAPYDYEGTERASTTTIGAIVHVSEVGDVPSYTPDYYVSSSTGDDLNDGSTEALAWKTLAKVETEITSADAGKVIAFKKGDEWNEMFNLQDVKGTSGNEIAFTSYGNGAKPIINNKTTSTFTWTLVSGNIWKTTLADAPPRLIVDGTERLGGSNMLYADLGTGVPDLVEWWHGSGELYFWATSTPDALEFEYSTAAQSRSLMLIECDFITLEGLEIKGGDGTSVTIYGCDNLIVDNCDVGDLSASGISFYSYSGTHNSNATIKNCTFDANFNFDYSTLGTYSSAENTGSDDGIYVRSLKVGSFYNNTFKNWGHASISISPQGIESSGYVAHDIDVYSNTLESTIAYGGRFGMSGNSYNVEVWNNIIDGNKAPIQFNGYNNHFHHNIVKNGVQSPLKLYKQAAFVLQGYGINSHDNIVENNLFLNNTRAAFGIDGYHSSCNVEDNIIRNNIIYECGTANSNLAIDLKIDEVGDFDAINNEFYNNDIYSSSATSTVNDNSTLRTVATWNGTTTKGNTVTSNISGDPDFVNPLSDWHLETGSPAINTGTPALSTIDYYGQTMNLITPDIGISDNN